MASSALRGTPSELSGRLIVNGRRLNQPEISMLSRLLDGQGIEKVGTAKRTGSRGGKPATILEIDPTAVKFEFKMGRKTRGKGHPDDADENGNTGGDNGNGGDNGSKQASAPQDTAAPQPAAVDPNLIAAIGQAVAIAMAQQGKQEPAAPQQNATADNGSQDNGGQEQDKAQEPAQTEAAASKQDETNTKSVAAKKSSGSSKSVSSKK